MRSIKYLTVIVLALVFSGAAKAEDTWLSKFAAGAWEGRVANSVSEGLNGKKFNATVVPSSEGVLITTKLEGANGAEREEWKLTPTQLIQTEYDAEGKAVTTYTADRRVGSENIYDIRCEDRAANKCDAGIDKNNHWVLDVQGNTFTYIVRGLTNKEDPTSVGERHRFVFKPNTPTTEKTATATGVQETKDE